MEFILIVLFFLFVLVAILTGLRKRTSSSEDWPFYAKKPLTQVEQILYHRLVVALPECIVLAQVQLSRILGVKRDSTFTSGITASIE